MLIKSVLLICSTILTARGYVAGLKRSPVYTSTKIALAEVDIDPYAEFLNLNKIIEPVIDIETRQRFYYINFIHL